MSKPNCNGSFELGTACGECERCEEEAGAMFDRNWGSFAERQKIARLTTQPCPLCGSKQVQVCLDYNNPIKDLARCRVCKCQAPLSAWNSRSGHEPIQGG